MTWVYMHSIDDNSSTSCIIHSSLLPLSLYTSYNDNGSNDEWMMLLVSLTIILLWMMQLVLLLSSIVHNIHCQYVTHHCAEIWLSLLFCGCIVQSLFYTERLAQSSCVTPRNDAQLFYDTYTSTCIHRIPVPLEFQLYCHLAINKGELL